MSYLEDLTISKARDLLENGEVSAVALTESYLERIEASKKLNTFCLKTADLALEKAKFCDKKIRTDKKGKLFGIPLGIKDIFCIQSLPTQAASKILEGFVPNYESTVTKKLWAEDAIMLGKLNMDEFAMGSSNETSIYGPAINPWQTTNGLPLTPGGSSGGSAAAVAANLCLGTLGTDTGGSIRQPAAFNGVVGMKPTYGRCSRWGIIAFASSLDQAGPITKTVRDSAILLEVISGHDKMDSTSAIREVPNFEKMLTGDIRGKKIGIPLEYRIEGTPNEIIKLWEDGIEQLKGAGAEIIDISLPHTKYSLPTYYVLAPAEASSNLARYDGVKYGYRANLKDGEGIEEIYKRTRSEGFGNEVKRRVMIGTYVLSAGFYEAYYQKALKVRNLIKMDFENVFSSGINAILTPTTPTAAFPLGSKDNKSPVEMYLNDVFTVPVNLAGLPAISIPTGMTKDGLPLGLQIIGPAWEESEVFNIAFRLEKECAFSDKPTQWWTN